MGKTRNKRQFKGKTSPLRKKCATVFTNIEEDPNLGEDALQRIANNLKSGKVIGKILPDDPWTPLKLFLYSIYLYA